MKINEEPFAPVLIERPDSEDPHYSAYNMDGTYAFVMGNNSTISSTIQSYKYNLECMEDLVENDLRYPMKEETLEYLHLTPRFFLAEEGNHRIDDEREFPVIIFRKDIGTKVIYIAACMENTPFFGEIHGNGHNFKEAKENWIKNWREFGPIKNPKNKPVEPIFFFETDGTEK